MCIVHSGMAYAIHIEILIIMLLITCHSTWTELQPQCRCEFMRNVWEWEWKWHIGKVIVLYLSTIGLAHTQKLFCCRILDVLNSSRADLFSCTTPRYWLSLCQIIHSVTLWNIPLYIHRPSHYCEEEKYRLTFS